MKNAFLSVICFLTSILCLSGTASAQQWIIDGQQTQVLKLEVSDPQALYTDGSRPMEAPIAFTPSFTATGGMFRAYIPWSEQTADLFRLDGDDECIKLSSDPNVSFQVGGILINTSGLGGYGVSVGFEDNTLFGPWKLNQVVDNSLALLNRSYADSRYVMNGQDAVELGIDTVASGDSAAAFGYKNHASGKYSVAFNGAVDPEEPEEGIYTNVASGMGSAVFGWGNIASGNGSVAFGWESVASGNWSLAAGSSDAIGEFSTALGEVCDASGSDSFAAGYNTSATGSKSVAFGHSTTASALGSFANGFASSASGNYSTAWGSYCEASGLNAVALGTRAKALHPGSVVIADSRNADVTSATNDTFTVRAKNGVYLQTDAIHSSGPLVFDSTLTATNGALQIYSTDSEDHLGYFKTLNFQDGLQFSTAHSASLFFGMNSNDGLLIGPDSIMQLGYNARIEFETGTLTGVSEAKQWHVAADPTAASGIVNKGYADGRYLRNDTPLTNSLLTSVTNGPLLKMSTGPGFLRPYGNKIEFTDDQTKYLFFVEGDSGNDTGLRVQSAGVYRYEDGSLIRGVELETGTLYGKWYLTDVDENEESALINRLYADGRYLRRTEGITTNRVIQAGDTLVISNGLITAINP